MRESFRWPASVLVHACCAPCSTVAVERLAGKSRTVFFFYGPNIHPEGEYQLRLDDTRRLCRAAGIELIEGPYEPAAWEETIAPWRHLPEGSERCHACYRLRMQATARRARGEGLEAFGVTLTVSRHKDSGVLARIGREVAAAEGVSYLEVDLKKQNGYGRSVELSHLHDLRRQDYCGCSLSLAEALARRRRRTSP